MRRVLVLGSGLVSRPLVQYLLDRPDTQVTVASRTLSKAERLVQGHARGQARQLDVTDQQALERLVAQCDLAVSLLPYAHHVDVARACLAHGKHLVTTSYVQDSMRALDRDAREAGVLLLNEVGLDPGIDHMSAMSIIHRIQADGGTVIHFSSYCGGLPAPEANTNPFGYKFSWSPRGVLLASKNPALFLRGGEEIHVRGDDLFDNYWTVTIPGLGDFEGYPNRNSLPYLDLYGLKEAQGIFRGTLRNPGWCSALKAIAELGLLDDGERPGIADMTWADLMESLIDVGGSGTLRERVAEHLDLDPASAELDALEWLGVFDDVPLPGGARSPLDALEGQMLQKMQYGSGERDMVILKHELIVEYPDRSEQVSSTLIDYGIPHGDSAMARLVGLPAAIAARLILDGTIDLSGVHIPVVSRIYEPILRELEGLGVRFVETTVSFD